MNKEISVYDNTISARTYLSYIAEQAGGFAIIGRDGKLYIKTIGEKSVALPLKLFKNFKWGEKFKITRVRYEDGIQMYEKGTVSGNTVYINQENMFIVNQEQIDNIYNSLKDLEVYSFEGEAIIDPALDIGDILMIDDKKVIYQGSGQYSGRWIANISSKIQGKSKEETTAKKTSQKVINRRVQSQIDQTEGKITQLIEETTEQSRKITEVEQTIDGISQKVENIQDFTKEKIQNENIFLDDIAEGEGYLLNFIIYGNTELFNTKEITICASQNQRGYGEAIYLLTESGDELLTEDNQQFVIGEGSYYLKSLKLTLDDYLRSITKDGQDHFDTLEIAQDGTIKVIRRIGVNAQGGLYVLAEEQETILEEKLVLPSQQGQTYYFIKEVQGLNYYAKYIIENDYSKTFLPKLELGTKIEQNAEAVKVAWNQISDFIQMMIVNNEISLAILNKDNKIMMTLDKTGQHFFEEDGNIVFGEMGIEKEDKQNYIAFSVAGEYGKKIENGMAWGIKTTKDDKFHPILYIKNFQMSDESSDASYGELVLNSCEIVLDGIGTGILSGDIKIYGNAIGNIMYFEDITNNKMLMEIHADEIYLDNNNQAKKKNVINILSDILVIGEYDGSKEINIFDKINFFTNESGSNSLKIGDGNNYSLITDDGHIQCTQKLEVGGTDYFYVDSDNIRLGAENSKKSIMLYPNIMVDIYGDLNVHGEVWADKITSDRRIKDNIKDSEVNALDIIKKIKHKQFDKKTDGKHYNIGYIAQEMEKIDPNFVLIRPKTDKADEMYYINELPIIATLSKAIQEQQQQMEDLKQIINNQQKQINKLLGGK